MLKERRNKNIERKEVIKIPEPSLASEDSSEEQDSAKDSSEGQESIEDSGNESTIGRCDGDIETVRKRYKSSGTEILDQTAAQDDHSVSSGRDIGQVQEGPLLHLVANCWRLIKTIVNEGWRMIWTFLRIPIILYPTGKGLFLGYIVWLAIAYLAVSIYRSATVALAPMCSVPVVGPWIAFCTASFELNGRWVNISKVATSQDALTVVMDRVGQNFDLARDMVGHEFAVRDLRIRVVASNLSRKEELTKELESLIWYTKQTAK